MNNSVTRSTRDVIEDHVRLRLEDKLEEDLRRNYSDEVVLLTVNSSARGYDALRMSADRLKDQLPEAEFEIVKLQAAGPYALLIWSASSSGLDAVEGSDSFVVEEGKIVFHSIHYGLVRDADDALSSVTTDDHAPGSNRE